MDFTFKEYKITVTVSVIPSLDGSRYRYDKRHGHRKSFTFGVLLTILLHCLVLLLILKQPRKIPLSKPKGESVAMVFIPPLAAAAPKPSVKPAPKPKPKPIPEQEARPAKPRPVTVSKPEPPPVDKRPMLPDTVVVRRDPPPEEDMMARVEAARKRRAEAQPRPQTENAEPVEDDNQRALRIARANIAGAQTQHSGSSRDNTGGMFQIRNLGYHTAEFIFNGWNENFRRNWTQQIHVEQGNEDDIQIAIIKKMIDLIRKYKQDDFVWDSRRLGKPVTVSARLEDTKELQQFLMREFFPDYHPQARR